MLTAAAGPVLRNVVERTSVLPSGFRVRRLDNERHIDYCSTRRRSFPKFAPAPSAETTIVAFLLVWKCYKLFTSIFRNCLSTALMSTQPLKPSTFPTPSRKRKRPQVGSCSGGTRSPPQANALKRSPRLRPLHQFTFFQLFIPFSSITSPEKSAALHALPPH